MTLLIDEYTIVMDLGLSRRKFIPHQNCQRSSILHTFSMMEVDRINSAIWNKQFSTANALTVQKSEKTTIIKTLVGSTENRTSAECRVCNYSLSQLTCRVAPTLNGTC